MTQRKYIRTFMNFYDEMAVKHNIQERYDTFVAAGGLAQRTRAQSASIEHDRMFGSESSERA